ncbi:MAG: DsbA family oxidoreductase [Hyphomonadaceae bacterium]
MAAALRIDFVSDVACPWCVIGLRSLLVALKALEGAVDAEIVLQPFELNPDMGPEGENVTEHVQKKYGSTREQSNAAREAIRNSGAAFGFVFRYGDDSRIWNTFDAHRLLHWARLEGKQLGLKEALFRANFTDQSPISDRRVLVGAAAAAGLDAARAEEVLVSGAFAEEVRREEAVWRERGIHAVPSIVLDQRWMIQGAQPPEVFERAIRDRIAAPSGP